jgi:hypothetical protein
LLLFTALVGPNKGDAVSHVPNGTGLLTIGTAVAVGVCVSALAHAARAGRPLVLVALVLLGALPLLVANALADVGLLGIALAASDRDTDLQLERLASVLPPVASAVLAAATADAAI